MTTLDEPVVPATLPPPPTPDDQPVLDEREQRLANGADQIGNRPSSILAHPKFLLIASATVMSIGVTMILLGWAGAAGSTLVEEQVPYLISGGLLGLALSVIGALMLFTHWLTVSVREARAHEAARRADHAELMDGLRALTAGITTQGSSNGSAGGETAQRPLRASARRS